MALYEDMKVFSGNAHRKLAKDICAYMDIPLGKCEVFKFSNDNTFVKILENIRQQDVFLVQPIAYPVNDHIMELLIMIDAAKRASAGRITAVVPYFAYARSDKKDQPRVPITARLVANLIETAGADRVLTLELHAGQIQGFFNIPLDELSAIPELAQHFKERQVENNIVVVATDAGDAKRARNMAYRLYAPLAIVEKVRMGNQERVESATLIGDVRDRTAIIVDDEIGTGGTVIATANTLRNHGARDIYCYAAHPVLAGNATEVLERSDIRQLVVTDSLPIPHIKMGTKTSVISVAPMLGEAIQRIHSGSSVGAMFNGGGAT
ncbi:MAG: ribose-phosphate pyrophosphokinase [Chloroflexi bacterium]|nr:ribose-phosphate pyrophosphokinase [Chloroflexota bacterium]